MPRYFKCLAQRRTSITKSSAFPVRGINPANGTSHFGAVNQRWDLDFTTEAANVTFGSR
jgi:hypothetical protein